MIKKVAQKIDNLTPDPEWDAEDWRWVVVPEGIVISDVASNADVGDSYPRWSVCVNGTWMSEEDAPIVGHGECMEEAMEDARQNGVECIIGLEREQKMRYVLLNTSILTAHGTFKYTSSTAEECAGLLIAANVDPDPDGEDPTEVVSAVGHESTAQIMSELLNYPVKMNRIQYRQEKNDVAIVFKMKGRPPEGKILSRSELEKIGFEFGILKMIESDVLGECPCCGQDQDVCGQSSYGCRHAGGC